MRTLAALALYVSLAFAGDSDLAGKDWDSTNKDGLTAFSRSDFQSAEALFRDSLKCARTPRESAISAGNIGAVLHRSGRDPEAVELLEHAWHSWKDPATAAQLAVLYRFGGDYVRAEQVARAALKESPADPEAKTILLNTVADILREQAQDAESRALFDEAWHVPNAPWRCRIESLEGLADLNRDTAKWQDAVQLARDHRDRPLEGVAIRGLGETWMKLKNPARAEPLLRQALAIFEADSEGDSHQTASTLSALAQVYIGDDKIAVAEDALLRALKIEEKVLGNLHPQIAMILQMLGDTAGRLNRIDQARRYFSRASLIMCARFGETSPIEGSVFANLGTIEQRSNHLPEAAAAYQKSLAILESAGPELEGFTMTVRERYAQVLKATHHAQEAKSLLAQVKGFRAR